MPLRPLAISILIFIFFIIGFYEIYQNSSQSKHLIYQFAPNEKWVGIIDMDYDHGIDMEGVLRGEDVLLTVDYNNPLFQQLDQKNRASKAVQAAPGEFEIGDYDSNGDGIINVQDPIYPFLHIIIFDPVMKGYVVKDLASAGIRAIHVSHLTPNTNHEVVLADGSRRVLYEVNKPGGTAIYKNRKGMQTRTMPEAASKL